MLSVEMPGRDPTRHAAVCHIVRVRLGQQCRVRLPSCLGKEKNKSLEQGKK